jgi:hypothetical protein
VFSQGWVAQHGIWVLEPKKVIYLGWKETFNGVHGKTLTRLSEMTLIT